MNLLLPAERCICLTYESPVGILDACISTVYYNCIEPLGLFCLKYNFNSNGNKIAIDIFTM